MAANRIDFCLLASFQCFSSVSPSKYYEKILNLLIAVIYPTPLTLLHVIITILMYRPGRSCNDAEKSAKFYTDYNNDHDARK